MDVRAFVKMVTMAGGQSTHPNMLKQAKDMILLPLYLPGPAWCVDVRPMRSPGTARPSSSVAAICVCVHGVVSAIEIAWELGSWKVASSRWGVVADESIACLHR